MNSGATRLWSATLNPSSPRYLDWRKVFTSDSVPVLSPFPVKAILGNEEGLVYALDWDAMDGDTSERLIDFIAKKFNTTKKEVERQINDDGVFPIRESDVIVSYSLKSFI